MRKQLSGTDICYDWSKKREGPVAHIRKKIRTIGIVEGVGAEHFEGQVQSTIVIKGKGDSKTRNVAQIGERNL